MLCKPNGIGQLLRRREANTLASCSDKLWTYEPVQHYADDTKSNGEIL